MDHAKNFIQVGPYTINTDRIEYVELLADGETAINFALNRQLVLKEDEALTFHRELSQNIGKAPNW